LRCLESLGAITYPSAQVLLVDNGSDDGTEQAIAEQSPDVRGLRNPENVGAAKGRNQAIDYATSQLAFAYMLFLDNDTVVTPGFLEPLVEAHGTDESVGLASAKLHRLLEPGVIDDGGGCRVSFYTGSTQRRGSGEVDRGQYDRPAEPDCVPNTGCLLVSRDVIESCEGFDTGLDPFGFEDLDFSLRAMKQGYAFRFVPESLVHHKGNMTGFGGYTAEYAKLKGRNLRQFLARHATPWQRLCFHALLPLLALRTIAREVLRGNPMAPFRLMTAYFKRES
jgi:GT2 family glycosyltransferase